MKINYDKLYNYYDSLWEYEYQLQLQEQMASHKDQFFDFHTEQIRRLKEDIKNIKKQIKSET